MCCTWHCSRRNVFCYDTMRSSAPNLLPIRLRALCVTPQTRFRIISYFLKFNIRTGTKQACHVIQRREWKREGWMQTAGRRDGEKVFSTSLFHFLWNEVTKLSNKINNLYQSYLVIYSKMGINLWVNSKIETLSG